MSRSLPPYLVPTNVGELLPRQPVTRITAKLDEICQLFPAHMNDPILVREWSAGTFHQRVLELESQGYIPRRETYRITPEMNPETGAITHLHLMEMLPPEPDTD